MTDINKCEESVEKTIERASEWNLWNEREFIENMSIQRLNYLLVFVGLIVAGATQSMSCCKSISNTILVIGIFICIFMWVIVKKAFLKIDKILGELEHRNKHHPVIEVWRNVPNTELRSNDIQSCWIPGFCVLLLVVILAVANCPSSSSPSPTSEKVEAPQRQ